MGEFMAFRKMITPTIPASRFPPRNSSPTGFCGNSRAAARVMMTNSWTGSESRVRKEMAKRRRPRGPRLPRAGRDRPCLASRPVCWSDF